MKKTYIAKKDSWFDTGTEAKLIEYIHNIRSEKFGNFEGTYTVGKNEGYDKFWYNKGHEEGDKVIMREICSYDEFEIHDKLPDEVIINKMAFEYVESVLKDEPNGFLNDSDIRQIGYTWKQGFKEGFKYLSDLYQKQNELEKK